MTTKSHKSTEELVESLTHVQTRPPENGYAESYLSHDFRNGFGYMQLGDDECRVAFALVECGNANASAADLIAAGLKMRESDIKDSLTSLTRVPGGPTDDDPSEDTLRFRVKGWMRANPGGTAQECADAIGYPDRITVIARLAAPYEAEAEAEARAERVQSIPKAEVADHDDVWERMLADAAEAEAEAEAKAALRAEAEATLRAEAEATLRAQYEAKAEAEAKALASAEEGTLAHSIYQLVEHVHLHADSTRALAADYTHDFGADIGVVTIGRSAMRLARGLVKTGASTATPESARAILGYDVTRTEVLRVLKEIAQLPGAPGHAEMMVTRRRRTAHLAVAAAWRARVEARLATPAQRGAGAGPGPNPASLSARIRAWVQDNPTGTARQCAVALNESHRHATVKSTFHTLRSALPIAAPSRLKAPPAASRVPAASLPSLAALVNAAVERTLKDPSANLDLNKVIANIRKWTDDPACAPAGWQLKTYKALTGKEWPS